jgi:hypothetical protein
MSCWARGGLSILPKVNLVENIGFNAKGTHTRLGHPRLSTRTRPLRFPLQKRPNIERDVAADDFTESALYSGPWWKRAARNFRNAIRD